MGARRVRSIAGVVVALVVGGAAACVLADPPAGIPDAPIEPPQIVRESVVPNEPFLIAWPSDFSVPVLPDPRELSIEWQFIIDQDPLTTHDQDVEPDGGLFVEFADPQEPPYLAECHTIELRVTYRDAPGEDSIFWFYSPTQAFQNCPIYDAGTADAGTVDSGAADDGGSD
jgi:hypothetical protein